MRKSFVAAVAALSGLGLAIGAPAKAVTLPYSTGTAAVANLGGHTPGDTLSLGSAIGALNGPGTYTLSNVSFSATNFPITPIPFSGSLADTLITLNGTSNYSVAYSLQLGAYDTITVGGNSFVAEGLKFFINPLVLTAGSNQSSIGKLTATVAAAAVPEPASWALLIAGFGGVGAMLRRRRGLPALAT